MLLGIEHILSQQVDLKIGDIGSGKAKLGSDKRYFNEIECHELA